MSSDKKLSWDDFAGMALFCCFVGGLVWLAATYTKREVPPPEGLRRLDAEDVRRFDDPQRGVTCYFVKVGDTGTLSCLPTGGR